MALTERQRKRRALACLRRGDIRGFDRWAEVLNVTEIVFGAVSKGRWVELWKRVPVADIRAHVKRGVEIER